jgi:hypothetical protein
MTVTNYNGNVVDWQGTAEEALARGLNVDCTGCTGCTHCSGCCDCSGCSDCSDCYGCSDCSGCTRCSGCSGCCDCTDCTDCSCCSDCTEQPVAVISTGTWIICIRKDGTMKIGCQDYILDHWLNFNDTRIQEMHGNALAFWRIWKPVVESVVASCKIS